MNEDRLHRPIQTRLAKIKDNNPLKEWLATPVDTERTDALSEHDLVM